MQFFKILDVGLRLLKWVPKQWALKTQGKCGDIGAEEHQVTLDLLIMVRAQTMH